MKFAFLAFKKSFALLHLKRLHQWENLLFRIFANTDGNLVFHKGSQKKKF